MYSSLNYLEGAREVLSERKSEEAEDGHCRLHHDELQRGLLRQAEQSAVPTHASQAAERERVRNLPNTKQNKAKQKHKRKNRKRMQWTHTHTYTCVGEG